MISDHVADTAFQHVSFQGLPSRHTVGKEYGGAVRVDNVTPPHFKPIHVVKTEFPVEEYFVQSSERLCLQACFIERVGGIYISEIAFPVLEIKFYDSEILIFVECQSGIV